MSKRKEHTFESVIALKGIPCIAAGTKGLVTGQEYRSISILWEGRTLPVDYERPGIEAMIQEAPKAQRPANRVSKPKKTEVSPAV
jgi:hypothetical protein